MLPSQHSSFGEYGKADARPLMDIFYIKCAQVLYRPLTTHVDECGTIEVQKVQKSQGVQRPISRSSTRPSSQARGSDINYPSEDILVRFDGAT
ncbi:unnamed protein product [Linum trigynum]|uniref:Uncharacterized protein n=1 Tax=Linum trigynum TaxID=586398 RepID=A0AAV2ECG7_9ROSI